MVRLRLAMAAVALLLATLPMLAAPAAAQTPFEFEKPSQDEPALIDADAIRFNRIENVVIAEGDVQVVQGGRALSADRIEYYADEDRVVAIGSVVLLDPGGQVVNAERAELTGGLRRAVAEELGLKLSDGSRMVGRSVERVEGVGTTLEDGAFTPCAACETDPDRPPLWRLRARKVEHDEVERDIRYEDVTLDIAGTPVAYLPFFSHPDPTVRRRSGFISPTLFFGGEFSAVTQVPYFWNIKPNVDLTLQPYLTAESAPVPALEYRHLFESGYLRFDGSLGILKRVSNNGLTEKNTERGHAFLDGQFALDDTWRLTMQGRVTSDDSYLETFNIDGADVLRNQLKGEGFWRRSYVRVGAFAAQELRENVGQNATPYALPELHAAYRGPDIQFGNPYARLDARALARDKGADGQMASTTLGWEKDLTTAGGHLFNFDMSLRADLYNSKDAIGAGARVDDGSAARFMPRLAADWRFPLVQSHGWGDLVLEPRVQAVAAADGARDRDIPNEDARAVEFDDGNIFALDRFPGLDRIDDGQRVDYGLTLTGFFEGGHASAFAGQSTARKAGEFYRDAGMSGRSSDVVTAVNASPADWLDLSWRTRLAKEDFDVRRNEISAVVGPDWLKLSASYVESERELQGPEVSVPAEQVTLGMDLKLDEFWRINTRHRHDLNAGRALFLGGGISYVDECISIDLGFGRDYASQADGGGREDTVFLRINFKHLGGLGVSQGVGENRGGGR